jgi:predicted Zn-dependent peptidase
MNPSATRDIQAVFREQVVPMGAARHGLVIGIESYADSRLNLRCARADAMAIYELMVDPECGLFPQQNVRLLLDADARTQNVRKALSNLRRNAGAGDTVWIYYAGHAAPEDSSVFWVLHDSDVDDLQATGMSNDEISRSLANIRTRQTIVMLDCCHAAATAIQMNPTRAVLTAEQVLAGYLGQGCITLSASDGSEKSVELGDVGHGAFTYFLAKGLRGEADRDHDGVVTADELWAYLNHKVVEAARKAGNRQTPVLRGQMTHDLAMSLNPIATHRKRAMADAIENTMGLRGNQLTTEEAGLCLQIVQRGPQDSRERIVLGELEHLAEGNVRIASLKALLPVAEQGDRAQKVEPPAFSAIEAGVMNASTVSGALFDELAANIVRFVGLSDDHLTTDEARLCLDIVQRGPRNAQEKIVSGELEYLAQGKVRIIALKVLIEAARQAPLSPHALTQVGTEPATATSAEPSTRLPCPSCGRMLNVQKRAAGKQRTCPACKKTLQISVDCTLLVLVNDPAVDLSVSRNTAKIEFRQYVLFNGLEVVAECNPESHSVALGFFVKTGSRDETDNAWGISHFLHMTAFRGTAKRTADDINRAFDEMGAQYNAFTSEEQTVYYANVLPEYQRATVELWADILRPALRTSDVDSEREVVYEAIRMYEDQPPFGADDRAKARHFGKHALGRSVLGTRKSVGAINADMMRNYLQQRYGPDNIVLVATGKVDFDDLVSAAEEYCGGWVGERVSRRIDPTPQHSGFECVYRDSQWEYFIQVANGPAATDGDRFAAKVLATILGDNTSSRLYWQLVDSGLADKASLDHYEYHGTGLYSTYFSCPPKEAQANLERVRKIYRRAESEGVTAAELEQAKSKINSRVVLGSEKPRGRLFSVGANWTCRRAHRSVKDDLNAVDAVTLADVSAVLRKYSLLASTTVGIGPVKDLRDPTLTRS